MCSILLYVMNMQIRPARINFSLCPLIPKLFHATSIGKRNTDHHSFPLPAWSVVLPVDWRPSFYTSNQNSEKKRKRWLPWEELAYVSDVCHISCFLIRITKPLLFHHRLTNYNIFFFYYHLFFRHRRGYLCSSMGVFQLIECLWKRTDRALRVFSIAAFVQTLRPLPAASLLFLSENFSRDTDCWPRQ